MLSMLPKGTILQQRSQIIKPPLYVYDGDMLRHNQARVLQRMSCQLVRLG
jgi:hypothetical protein